MRLGVTVPNSGGLAAGDASVILAVLAEQLGFDSVWVVDHLILPHRSSQSYPYTRQQGVTLPADWAFLDPLITLAAIASRTERVLLGTGVYLMPLRHPIAAAKAAASLDVLSHGRLLLGVGLGWIKEEYEALGLPWEARGRLFDEQIDYVRALWRDAAPEFRGEFWQAGGFGFEPKPVKRTIPLLIGGKNDPARRRAAKRGDGWHLIDMSPDEVREARAALDQDCRAVGRDPAEVPISMYASVLVLDDDVPDDRREFPLMGSIDQIAATVADYGPAGVDHLVLAPRGLSNLADYEALYRRVRDRV
jgi:probable F420-dependent oxidoreductase